MMRTVLVLDGLTYQLYFIFSIGKIYKINVWHDNTGSSPSWFVERIVIRSLVNGEKFFFFCNRLVVLFLFCYDNIGNR